MTNPQQELPPRGFELFDGAVSWDAWLVLQEWIQTNQLRDESVPIPWEIGAQNRPVAQFGFRYDYEQDTVDTTTPTRPIPPALLHLLDIPPHFTQCIINKYEPDISTIPWHMDDLSFGPSILVYSFGEARPLLLRRATNHEERYQAIPSHCSKYVLQDEARYEWEHMVPTGKGHRTSFTFRSASASSSAKRSITRWVTTVHPSLLKETVFLYHWALGDM